MWSYIILGIIVIGIIWYLNRRARFNDQKKTINRYYGKKVTDAADKIFHTNVAGVTKKNGDGSIRQNIIENDLKTGDLLILERDLENKHDKNAIAVLTTSNKQVGFIRSDHAQNLAKQMDNGSKVFAQITAITGGYNGKNFGVNIDIYKAA